MASLPKPGRERGARRQERKGRGSSIHLELGSPAAKEPPSLSSTALPMSCCRSCARRTHGPGNCQTSGATAVSRVLSMTKRNTCRPSPTTSCFSHSVRTSKGGGLQSIQSSGSVRLSCSRGQARAVARMASARTSTSVWTTSLPPGAREAASCGTNSLCSTRRLWCFFFVHGSGKFRLMVWMATPAAWPVISRQWQLALACRKQQLGRGWGACDRAKQASRTGLLRISRPRKLVPGWQAAMPIQKCPRSEPMSMCSGRVGSAKLAEYQPSARSRGSWELRFSGLCGNQNRFCCLRLPGWAESPVGRAALAGNRSWRTES
mmetsp:Transcript_24855/g.69273  ORF Transcript_24855/g.69273 Transcript_24855/m.69273 type:complete len:319 (-) Transcript_24855:292-1248(-)